MGVNQDKKIVKRTKTAFFVRFTREKSKIILFFSGIKRQENLNLLPIPPIFI
jgi:hypothetical protein